MSFIEAWLVSCETWQRRYVAAFAGNTDRAQRKLSKRRQQQANQFYGALSQWTEIKTTC